MKRILESGGNAIKSASRGISSPLKKLVYASRRKKVGRSRAAAKAKADMVARLRAQEAGLVGAIERRIKGIESLESKIAGTASSVSGQERGRLNSLRFENTLARESLKDVRARIAAVEKQPPKKAPFLGKKR